MKRLALTTAVAAVCVCAHAAVNLNIDVQYQTVTKPLSGTTEVVFTGTIDILLPDFDLVSVTLEYPYDGSGNFLNVNFHNDLFAYFGAGPGVDYTGNLFYVEVESTTLDGFYFYDISEAALAEFIVTVGNGTVSDSDNEFFGVNVVPEPASMAVLGIGALAFLRRRKS